MSERRMTAYLSPAFLEAGFLRGRVHSVFSRAVNLTFAMPAGYTRLLTLLSGLPRLPDSVEVPPEMLRSLRLSEEAALCNNSLAAGGWTALLDLSSWHGRMPRYTAAARAGQFRAARSLITQKTGFEGLPPALRDAAEQALSQGKFSSYIGLGPGLTPSFDDAVVGFMAVRAAAGRPLSPISEELLNRTTDVSAAYLRRAGEGCFSEPLCALMTAIYMGGDMAHCVRAVASVGATSGADALLGVEAGLQSL